MGLKFEFETASKIIFGNGSEDKIPEIISEMGKNVLLVIGKNPDRAKHLIDIISNKKVVSIFHVSEEPTVQIIDAGVQFARQNMSDVIVGFGGGSVIDSAKAIAALATNPGDLTDYLEVIGLGKTLSIRPLPVVAIPTTSGTGAEVTKNSVIKSVEHLLKVSLRSNLMYPDVAVIDPVLTWSMSPRLTASTGVNALTHLMETFVSNQSNPFIDNFCRQGMKRISDSLVPAFRNGDDKIARENMAMASMLGGMALANVKLGAVHGFAGPIGGMFPIPHGIVCARFLPAVMDMNISAIIARCMDISKYDEVAQILTGKGSAKAKDGIFWVEKLLGELEIPSLSGFGLTEKYFPELVEKAKNASSMKGNPAKLTDDQLTWILEQVM